MAEQTTQAAAVALLADKAALLGKTVADVRTANLDQDWLLLFTDGTGVVFHGTVSGGDPEVGIDAEPDDYTLVEFGLMDPAERDRRFAARQAAWRAQSEQAEREQYEKLKAKFGGK